MRRNRFRVVLTLAAVAILALAAGSAVAATMSVNLGVPPTVDGADIASLSGLVDIGGNQGHAWNNRPSQGQTFTTGGAAGGYTLDAYSLRVRVDQGSTISSNWEIRVGEVDGGGVFNTIATENAAGVTIPNSTSGNNYPSYITFGLDTPLTLSPNTLYGIDLDPNGGGFISLSDNTNPYAGGAAMSSDAAYPASPPNPLTVHSGADRHFHVNLEEIGGGGGGELAGELGILDLDANGGNNPATGEPWAAGDQYRFAFLSSTGTQSTSNDINTYNAFLQGLADASSLDLSGATWKVLGSTDAVDARDNTETNPGEDGTGVAIFLLDGSTIVANNNGDLWDGNIDNPLNLFEDGVTSGQGDVLTGTNTNGTKRSRHLGGSDLPDYKVTIGRAHVANGQWMVVYNTSPTNSRPIYGLSDPLTVTAGGAAVPEPSTFVLAALGLLGLAWYGRRRRRS